jgi:Flp pilus assembly protein TadD
MKATAIAVSLLPLYGCASLPSFSDLNPLGGLFRPERTTPTAPAKAAAQVQTPSGPQDVEGAILEAQNARKTGDLNQAAHILSQLVLFSPDDARVLAEYGKTLAGLGRSDDAVAFLERATQLAPSDWSLYSALGVAYDQKGNYKAAQSLYDRALELKPGDASVLNNAALSHMQAGDLDGAERLLHQVAPGTQDYARIAQNLALVEKLRAAQPVKPAAAESPGPAAAAAPAPIVSAVQPVTPPPVMAVDAPAVLSTPTVAADVSVIPPKQPIATAALETPAAPDRATQERSSLEALKADPAVRMQAVPKDEFASLRVPARPAVPKMAAAPAPKPDSLPSAATLAAAKPAAQTHVAANGAYYVQAGAFYKPDQAEHAAAGLDRLGARVMTGTVQGREVFRVRIGPFRNHTQASTAMELAQALGRKDLQIVME